MIALLLPLLPAILVAGNILVKIIPATGKFIDFLKRKKAERDAEKSK